MKTKIIRSISVVVLAGMTSSVIATSAQAADFNYNYIEGGFENYDLENIDANVGKLSGSYEITPKLNIVGEYAKGDLDNPTGGSDLDFEESAIGIEYHASIAPKTDVTTNIKYINQDIDTVNDEDGYGVGVGVRHWLTDTVEVDANIDYSDVDSYDTELKVGARYHFNDDISVGAGYSTSKEDVDVVSGNIRWNFK